MDTRRALAAWATVGAGTLFAEAAAFAHAAPAVVCVARPTAEFHLRPRPMEESVGPRMPARTELAVLDEEPRGTRAMSYLRHVRVVSSGATAYVYLSAAEYGPACVEPRVVNVQGDAHDPFDAEHVRRGEFSTIDAGLAPGWTATLGAEIDVDHDGQADRLVSATNGGRGDYLVALRRARGWQVQVVSPNNQGPCAWEPPVTRGAETWLVLRCISQGESGYSESEWELYRFDPRASALRLAVHLTGDRLLGGDNEPHPHHWRFEIPAANTVRVTGERGAPLRLRFDPARGTLAP